MPTVTVEGEKSFEVETGKKLVLAIEDAGIDIMHRCGGNGAVRPAVSRSWPATCRRWRPSSKSGLSRDEPGTEHPVVLPDPRRIRHLGCCRQPFQSNGNPGRDSAHGLSRGPSNGGARHASRRKQGNGSRRGYRSGSLGLWPACVARPAKRLIRTCPGDRCLICLFALLGLGAALAAYGAFAHLRATP